MTGMRRATLRRRPLGLLAFLLFLISVPAWAPNRFWINVASQALIFAIFAMSLDLLLGYGGMPSFGHAAFFAAGAYGCALWTLHRSPDLLPLMVLGLAAGAGLALIGALALRARGIFFLMLTLAFAQLVWSVLSNNQLAGFLGGDIGLIGVPRPVLPFLPDINLFQAANFYYLTLIVAVGVYLALVAITAFAGRHIKHTAAQLDPDELSLGRSGSLLRIAPHSEFHRPAIAKRRRMVERREIGRAIGDMDAVEQAMSQQARDRRAEHRFCGRRNELHRAVAVMARDHIAHVVRQQPITVLLEREQRHADARQRLGAEGQPRGIERRGDDTDGHVDTAQCRTEVRRRQ